MATTNDRFVTEREGVQTKRELDSRPWRNVALDAAETRFDPA